MLPFPTLPISLLRVHLNGIGNVTIHLNVPKNYEFRTNVGRLRLFLLIITCTYDLANGTAQNNLNGKQVFFFLLIDNVIINIFPVHDYVFLISLTKYISMIITIIYVYEWMPDIQKAM